ncbi:N-acetylglucosamine-specific PTS transporter subunit IIBC [Camelliibacillus cellulosilyticus]|uniref:N-acetylglucosamine-specific PTS transporter subunit IIBC n=1 Tax=Camelliibacillus cellulosilyticus TaxID=2174486 RepID=A0ABV9GK15_9BACL
MLAFFQKLGKSLMLPIAVLPAAGLLLRLGQPDLLNIPFIAEAGNAFFGNMFLASGQNEAAVFMNLALIFAIGVAIGFSKDNNGAAALAGAIGYLVMTYVTHAINGEVNMGVLGGIIAGILAGLLYNKFNNVKLPDWLAFFGGRRFVPIVTAGSSVVLGVFFGYVWIYVQNFINWLAHWIIDSGAIGVAIYGFLNRLLIPLGLHHIINTLIWFDFGSFKAADGTVYHGDITRFLHHDPTGGTFTAGFFPIMMFGLPAACLAMIVTAKTKRRRVVSGLLLGAALTSFITGVTEPIEFSFMFLSPLLYVVHALLTASSMAVTYLLGIHDSFSFSASLIDYLLNFGIATKPLLLLVIGIIYGVIYFVVFYFLIKWLNLKTPGREDEDEATEDHADSAGEDRHTAMAARFLKDLGGKKNLTDIDNCATRLRLGIADMALVDENALKRHGARGVVKTGKKNLQVIVGTTVEFVADAMKKLDDKDIAAYSGSADQPAESPATSLPPFDSHAFVAPLNGRLMALEEVPDEVFSKKMMGDGFAIDPSDGTVVSPIDGVVKTVFPTKHAIGLETKDGYEVLLHFGLDTVNLKGEGFNIVVAAGDNVSRGQRIAEIDLDGIKDKVPSIITPVIFTNLPNDRHVTLNQTGKVSQGDTDIIKIQ